MVNTISPGDVVLSVSIGVFGDRFAQLAEVYGASVVKLTATWGEAIDPEAIRDALKENPSVKVVLVTHNETSTGGTNDLAAISKVVKEFDKLLVVDAVSSLSSLPFCAGRVGLRRGGVRFSEGLDGAAWTRLRQRQSQGLGGFQRGQDSALLL